MAKVALQKYRLTQAQLRGLTIARYPALDQQDKAVMGWNKDGKSYRFGDATPGAPIGFRLYADPTGAFYELRTHSTKASMSDLPRVRPSSLRWTERTNWLAPQRRHIRQTARIHVSGSVSKQSGRRPGARP